MIVKLKLNTYLEEIVIAKAHVENVKPAIIVRQFLSQGLIVLGEHNIGLYQKHYHNMSDDEKRNPTK